MFDVFAVAQTDDIDDSDDDGLAGRGDTHQRAGVDGMEGLVCDDDVIFGHLTEDLYFKTGEGLNEPMVRCPTGQTLNLSSGRAL